MNYINDQPIEHMCCNGTTFKATRADLSDGVLVDTTFANSPNRIRMDFAEFGAWHAMNIRPNLNGFAGYDAVEYYDV